MIITGRKRISKGVTVDLPLPSAKPKQALTVNGGPQPASVKTVTKAVNVVKAMYRWALSGFDVADKPEAERRIAICRACPNWAEDGNAGFGECRHPSCGCTKMKTILQTEKCPIGNW